MAERQAAARAVPFPRRTAPAASRRTVAPVSVAPCVTRADFCCFYPGGGGGESAGRSAAAARGTRGPSGPSRAPAAARPAGAGTAGPAPVPVPPMGEAIGRPSPRLPLGVMASLKACQPTAGLALGADVMTYEPGVAGKAAHAPSVPQDGGGHQQRDGVRRGGGGREARPPRHPRGGLRGERGGAGGDRRDLRSGGRDRPP